MQSCPNSRWIWDLGGSRSTVHARQRTVAAWTDGRWARMHAQAYQQWQVAHSMAWRGGEGGGKAYAPDGPNEEVFFFTATAAMITKFPSPQSPAAASALSSAAAAAARNHLETPVQCEL